MSFKSQIRTSLATLLLTLSLTSVGMLPGTALAQAPAAAPAAAETKAAPAADAETLANPYGIEALWRQGDAVSRGTLIILIIMSMGSWYIGIIKLIEQAKMMKQAEESDLNFWKHKSISDGIDTLHEDSAFRFVADKGLKASEHHEGNLQQIDLNTWVGMAIQRSIDVVANRLGTGLAFLATVGSTAPFVGLFGTVWGIYHALTAIGIAGQASIEKVAGPVGESLIMTAMGLAVAVPAVLGYNWLVRRNKVVMELIRHFGGGVHMVLVSRHGHPAKGN